MRRAIAQRMTHSATTVPHFTVVSEIDMEGAWALRAELNALPEAPRVSVTDLVLRAVALTLPRFPALNASYSEDGLRLHAHVNLGLAMAVESGLLTPVLQEAEGKPLSELARLSAALIERARAGRLEPRDLADGTFTVSNLGMYDVEQFIPIINPPEAAKSGRGQCASETPAVVDGQLAVRKRMNVALTVDHRVSDGAEAARFLQDVKALVAGAFAAVGVRMDPPRRRGTPRATERERSSGGAYPPIELIETALGAASGCAPKS